MFKTFLSYLACCYTIKHGFHLYSLYHPTSAFAIVIIKQKVFDALCWQCCENIDLVRMDCSAVLVVGRSMDRLWGLEASARCYYCGHHFTSKKEEEEEDRRLQSYLCSVYVILLLLLLLLFYGGGVLKIL